MAIPCFHAASQNRLLCCLGLGDHRASSVVTVNTRCGYHPPLALPFANPTAVLDSVMHAREKSLSGVFHFVALIRFS